MKFLALLTLSACVFATEPNDATRRWWSHVTALANDGMEGRDTGSSGYQRAARYVAAEFERNGLKPAGENSYYQSVPLHVVRLRTNDSAALLKRTSGVIRLR